MSNVFPTIRREAAALGLTKAQTDKLVAEAAYDRDLGNAGHPKVFHTGKLFTTTDEGAQRLRDAAIADCLPARMKASSTSYAPGPMTPPKAKTEAKPEAEQFDPKAFWSDVARSEAKRDLPPLEPEPDKTNMGAPDQSGFWKDQAASQGQGEFTEFWRSMP